MKAEAETRGRGAPPEGVDDENRQETTRGDAVGLNQG